MPRFQGLLYNRIMSRSVSEVTVITVNWNGRDHLATLIPSLLSLECAEIIVVDNGSSDGSQEFVRSRFPKIRLLENPTNRGFCQPNNLAAQNSQTPLIAFINNDMRADPDWLAQAVPRLEGTVQCVASRILDWQGKKIDFNGSSLQYLGYALQKDTGSLVDEVRHQDRILFPCGGAMLINREVFLRLGGFDEDFFAIFEDVDLGWRLWISGYEVAYAPESIVYHRGHGTFRAHENEKMRYLMHRNALLTIFKNYEDEQFKRILPLAILQALRRAILLSGADKEGFYLWSRTRQGLQGGDAHLYTRLLDSLNHLVALEDALQSLPSILEKRRTIQGLRKRGDAELLQLFVDPLRPIVEDAEYQSGERHWLEALDLSALFEVAPPGKGFFSRLERCQQDRLEALRAEIGALNWLGMQALQHPPIRRRSRVRSFFASLRRDGALPTLRRLMGQVSRGI